MANEVGNSVFTKTVTASSSDQKEDLLTTRNEVVMIATGDCYINFDQEVDVDERMLLKANTYFTLRNIMVRTLHFLSESGTPSIYIVAVKKP